MKFLRKNFEQISFILISFLMLDVTIVNISMALSSHTNIMTYPFLGVEILLSSLLLFGISFLISNLLYKKLISWAIIIYFLYTSFSYLLQVTRNVNDPSFKVEKIFQNHFLQLYFLPVLFVITVMVILYKLVFKLERWTDFEGLHIDESNSNRIEDLLLAQFLLSLVFSDNKFLNVITKTGFLSKFYEEKLQINELFVFSLTSLIFLIFAIGSVLSFLAVKGMRDLYKNKNSFSVTVLFSAVFAMIFNYTIQNSIRGDISVLDLRLFAGASLFQIIIFFITFVWLYVIFNRFLLPTMLILTVGVGSSIASSLKFQYRQEPILPSDLVWLRNPKILLDFLNGNYIIYVILVLLLLGFLYWIFRKKILPNKMILSTKYRMILLVLPIIFYLGLFQVFSSKKDGKITENIPVVSILNNYHDLTWFGNTVNSQIRSLAFVWFAQLSDTTMTRPKQYSKKTIKNLEEKYKHIAVNYNQSRIEKIENQTVIYLLSESFSDPARVEGVTMSENPIPNIQEIRNRTTSGLMKSDGYGGGTANMEFQTLTGLPFYNLSPSISVIYTEVVPGMNKFPSISDFYNRKNRTVIHLASPSNYSRNIIYNDLGFNEFIHYGTKGLKGENIGGNYSDKTTYDQVLKNLKENQSQFFSVMTMQNHMPWTEPNPVTISANYAGFSDADNQTLSNYVRMLHHTDIATKDFLAQLSKINKKITVVFYGDHLPGLYPQSAFKNNPDSQYLTDYFVWSNYETPKLNYPVVNSSDFTALLLEQTNSKVSPYYALLTEVLHKASVDKKDLDVEGQQIAKDLKLIQYDMVAGKGYLSKNFFKVHSE
ncbi:sulfatase-like hydrolase/transferase [Streptococcus sp. NSJ-72]|uniref:LTA synthase family protein n=1 Tax=Streptococcus sp. NSJ-72 TaxID=2763068 RepID=UPI0016511F43|nr:alkaline phosphatase family protein [Streptococcus sp. NSJ-72]QNL41846.1 sulfatase-like hydrolase/transferase [Streptococcus sp. NSJ-72]